MEPDDSTIPGSVLEHVVSGKEDVRAGMEQTTRVSCQCTPCTYKQHTHAQKKFMGKEEGQRPKNATVGDGYVDFRDKMDQVSDGKGGKVWIRKENVGKWLNSLPQSRQMLGNFVQ